MGLLSRFKRSEPAAVVGRADPHREPFGFKTGWIAARTDDVRAVANALGVVGQQSAPWKSGVGEAYGSGVFVCPTVGGWTLAMGEGILTGDDIDVATVSRVLDAEVQLFRTHRIVEVHEWARAVDGRTVRAFAYSGERGEVIRSEGAATPVELADAAAAYCSELLVGPEPFDADATFPDELTVMVVAKGWSIDPTSLHGPDDRHGIIGRRPEPSPG